MSRKPLPSYDRLMGVAELRDDVMRGVGSAAALCRLRLLLRSTARYVDNALESLCSGRMLLPKIFPRSLAASDMLRSSGALLSGECIRQLMHTFDCTIDHCDLLVAPGQATNVMSHLMGQGYRIAMSNGDLAQYEREARGLADGYHLFVGGPSGRIQLGVVVATFSSMQLFIQSPLLRNVQAFDGTHFVDLYPALGPRGLSSSPDDVALWRVPFHDLRLFVPPTRRLGSVIPPTRAITIVHRYLGDPQCLVVPPASLPRSLIRNSWDVRLHAESDHQPGTRSWVVIDSEVLASPLLVHSYLQAPGLNFYIGRAMSYAMSLIAMRVAPGPASWDEELDRIIASYRTGTMYPLACFPRLVPFRSVDIVFTHGMMY